MKRFIKQNLLIISVFITGACVLIVEVVAVRALSPYYGNTIYTVSSVISVILASLSIGYYLGGKLADRHPYLNWFFGIILISSLVLIGLYLLGVAILPTLSSALSLTWGPLVSSVILYFFPALLLGTLSPYAIKLQSLIEKEKGIGTISGKIFFWSTLGSITGSLLAGFVLIPNFGINNIFIGISLTLVTLGFLPSVFLNFKKKGFFRNFLKIVLIVTVLAFLTLSQTDDNVLYSKDGIYEKLTIYDGLYQGRPTRFFKQDRSFSSAIFLDTEDPTDLVYEYTKYYVLYKILKPEVRNALVIGGGIYSLPQALLAELPEAQVDVSEIEPLLYKLSKKYFGVKENPRLSNYQEDGRRMLKESDKTYDLIFSDVYYSLYSVPSHFTTQEFFKIAKNKLSKDGIFIANLIGNLSRDDSSVIFTEIKTFQTVFENSYFFAVRSPTSLSNQNIIALGINGERRINFQQELIDENPNPIIRSLENKEIDLNRFELSPYSILTDNFAPTEHLTAHTIKKASEKKPDSNQIEALALVSQQLRYGPRYLGSSGHEQVQKFIKAELEAHLNETRVQSWQYTSNEGEIFEMENIIGRINPENERKVILATHYDSKKFAELDWENQKEPVPGANDSASGVAILLDTARILSGLAHTLNVGVDFVFFDGEEGDPNQELNNYQNWTPIGSTYFAKNLQELYQGPKPESAIVLDMVCDKDLKIYKESASVENAPVQVEEFWNLARNINQEVFDLGIVPRIKDDHTPLNQSGIPSILLIDFEYPPFHTIQDTLDKCSTESLETVEQAVLQYIYAQ